MGGNHWKKQKNSVKPRETGHEALKGFTEGLKVGERDGDIVMWIDSLVAGYEASECDVSDVLIEKEGAHAAAGSDDGLKVFPLNVDEHM